MSARPHALAPFALVSLLAVLVVHCGGETEGSGSERLPDGVTACSSDHGCRVRSRDCCECGGSTARADLIAITATIEADDAFMALVCGPRQACNDCAPGYPAPAVPRCREGHCVVEWVEPP